MHVFVASPTYAFVLFQHRLFYCFQGNYWKESLEILKIAVSNSSNLDTPPPPAQSTIWSSYESSWAIDALPIKKELPGRTLEFTYDLSSVPVIGTKHTLENTGEQAKITPDIPSPRKPNTSQVL